MTDTKQQANRTDAGPDDRQNGQSNGSGPGYNPDAPIEKIGNLRQLLDHYSDRIAEVMPEHLTADRMLKMTLIAFNKQPKLLDCTQGSIIQSVLECSELGLNISGTTGEAYLVPFWNNKQRRLECQLIVGYKGLIKLARQTGEVVRVEAEVVYENDAFTFRKGSEVLVDFRPYLKGDRGSPMGAYALVEFVDGSIQTEWMPATEIAKVKNASKASESGPWSSEFEGEMWRKSAWRRLSKWAPLSSERYNRALEVSDREFEWEVTERRADVDKAQAMTDRLLDAKREPDITPEDFERARQQREDAAEKVEAKQTSAKQTNAPQAKQQPTPESADDAGAQVVADTISQMQIEIEQCAECQTREQAVSCVQKTFSRYRDIGADWPAEDKKRMQKAYGESTDAISDAVKALPSETEGKKAAPTKAEAEVTKAETAVTNAPEPEPEPDDEGPPDEEPAVDDEFGTGQLFK